jgi:hypothetical protein
MITLFRVIKSALLHEKAWSSYTSGAYERALAEVQLAINLAGNKYQKAGTFDYDMLAAMACIRLREDTPHCKGGDSGGPVYILDLAHGLMKGYSYNTSTGACIRYWYMNLDYLPAGWTLLS